MAAALPSIWAMSWAVSLSSPARMTPSACLALREPTIQKKVGSTSTNSPAELKIWFTQELEPAFSSVEVRDAQDRQVDKKEAHLDAHNQRLFIVPLMHLAPGTYTVAWHVVSVDTHRTQGHFKFTIKRK